MSTTRMERHLSLLPATLVDLTGKLRILELQNSPSPPPAPPSPPLSTPPSQPSASLVSTLASLLSATNTPLVSTRPTRLFQPDPASPLGVNLGHPLVDKNTNIFTLPLNTSIISIVADVSNDLVRRATSRLTQLTHLCLFGATATDSTLAILAQNCRRLQHLKIADAHLCSEKGIGS